jgi:hypothetical protein
LDDEANIYSNFYKEYYFIMHNKKFYENEKKNVIKKFNTSDLLINKKKIDDKELNQPSKSLPKTPSKKKE